VFIELERIAQRAEQQRIVIDEQQAASLCGSCWQMIRAREKPSWQAC
jgi:hypothetical protein